MSVPMQRLVPIAPTLAQRANPFLLVPRWPCGGASPVPGSSTGSDIPGCATAKRIIFVRHAEGWHNKDYYEKPNYMEDGLGETEAYWDARLTPDGEDQSRTLAMKLQWRQQSGLIQLVAVSPLTRALQTASFGIPSVIDPKTNQPWPRPPFVATSLARERVWTHQCDRRRDKLLLAREFPHVDFSEIREGEDEMWAHKEDVPHPQNSTACRTRGVRFLHWLWQRPETEITVVTHWMFLLHLFSHYPEHESLNANFSNAEMRMATLMLKDPDTEPEPVTDKDEL